MADELARRKAEAAARKEIALNEQAAAEAEQKTAEARAATASAAERATRDSAKAEAETRKAIAEANAASAKAYLPGESTLKPLEGKVTADEKSGILADHLAYAMLGGAGADIANSVPLSKDSTVLIVGNRDLISTDWPYRAVVGQTDQLQGQVDAASAALAALEVDAPSEQSGEPSEGPDRPTPSFAAAPAALALAAGLPALVGAAADVAGYFTSDFTLAGRSFDAKSEPLIASTAAALRQKGVKVVVDGFEITADETQVLKKFQGLVTAASELQNQRLLKQQTAIEPRAFRLEREKVRLKSSEEKLSAIDGDGSSTAVEIAAARNERDACEVALRKAELSLATATHAVEAAKAAEAAVEEFRTAATTVPASGGLPPLGAAVARARIHAQTGSEKVTHVLYVTVSSAGGETQIRQRRFRSPVIRYVAMCTVSSLLADTSGNVTSAFAKSYAKSLKIKLVPDDDTPSVDPIEVDSGAATSDVNETLPLRVGQLEQAVAELRATPAPVLTDRDEVVEEVAL